MIKNKKNYVLTVLLLLCFAIIFTNSIGSVPIDGEKVFKILISKLPIVGNAIANTWKPTHETIILMIRMPRNLLAVLVGASLSVAGAIYQGIFKNPMAGPYIIGASSGASLGAALAIVFSLNLTFLGVGAVSLMAFFTSLFTVFLVYNMARVGQRVPVLILLLSGIAVSAFLSAVVSLLIYFSGNKLGHVVFWMMGSLASRGWNYVVSSSMYFAVGMAVAFVYSKDLNILLLGEDTAAHLGIDVERVKRILLAAASILTAAAVASAGLIGFVGLIIPHVVRLIIGPDNRWLLPASALTGGVFLLLADTLARVVISPTELPVGIVTALFGGPFFIYLLKKKKSS
jgi:iron complex transport system permease protein